MDATPECKAKFQREVKLISRMEHKNIVKVYILQCSVFASSQNILKSSVINFILLMTSKINFPKDLVIISVTTQAIVNSGQIDLSNE